MSPPATIEWVPDAPGALIPGRVRMIDQTRLPEDLVHLETADVEAVWEAIKMLRVRGAPAIGIAAAMGVVTAVQNSTASATPQFLQELDDAANHLATARPTAVNLFWALDRMKRVARAHADPLPGGLKETLAREAVRILEEDLETCRAIGRHGVSLLKDGSTVLTHCNAGGLATSRYGTALAPIYLAQEQGMRVHVIADETRPLLQGSRLTAWELQQAGVDVTVIADNMAAHVMHQGSVNVVLVGADRIAANGDTANKIGTYGVAILARAHQIPFYVLAPTSTFDMSLQSGDEIPIEERAASEITHGFGRKTAPDGVKVYSPAFDVTPAEYITAIVCEHGIAKPDYRESLQQMIDMDPSS